jgi:hypothetical protein
VQGRSTVSNKILTEKKFKLEYSKDPSFLRLKTRGPELIQILLPSTLYLVTAMPQLGHLDCILLDALISNLLELLYSRLLLLLYILF